MSYWQIPSKETTRLQAAKPGARRRTVSGAHALFRLGAAEVPASI